MVFAYDRYDNFIVHVKTKKYVLAYVKISLISTMVNLNILNVQNSFCLLGTATATQSFQIF